MVLVVEVRRSDASVRGGQKFNSPSSRTLSAKPFPSGFSDFLIAAAEGEP